MRTKSGEIRYLNKLGHALIASAATLSAFIMMMLSAASLAYGDLTGDVDPTVSGVPVAPQYTVEHVPLSIQYSLLPEVRPLARQLLMRHDSTILNQVVEQKNEQGEVISRNITRIDCGQVASRMVVDLIGGDWSPWAFTERNGRQRARILRELAKVTIRNASHADDGSSVGTVAPYIDSTGQNRIFGKLTLNYTPRRNNSFYFIPSECRVNQRLCAQQVQIYECGLEPVLQRLSNRFRTFLEATNARDAQKYTEERSQVQARAEQARAELLERQRQEHLASITHYDTDESSASEAARRLSSANTPQDQTAAETDVEPDSNQ